MRRRFFAKSLSPSQIAALTPLRGPIKKFRASAKAAHGPIKSARPRPPGGDGVGVDLVVVVVVVGWWRTIVSRGRSIVGGWIIVSRGRSIVGRWTIVSRGRNVVSRGR